MYLIFVIQGLIKQLSPHFPSYNKHILLSIENKDILAIHLCSYRTITHNIIVNNIMLGRGFIYANNKIWYPKEVWIYNPID